RGKKVRGTFRFTHRGSFVQPIAVFLQQWLGIGFWTGFHLQFQVNTRLVFQKHQEIIQKKKWIAFFSLYLPQFRRSHFFNTSLMSGYAIQGAIMKQNQFTVPCHPDVGLKSPDSLVIAALKGLERIFILFVRATPVRKKLRSEEHTSELQSRDTLVCRLLLE